MLVLLAFSTALALLVPEPRAPDGGTGREGTQADRYQPTSPDSSPDPSPGDEPAQTGESREESPRDEPVAGKGRTITIEIEAEDPVEQIAVAPGDRLVIEVRSRKPIVAAVVGTGLVDTAGPYDPARFDVLVRSPAKRIFVEDLDSGARLARIAVG